MKVVTDGDILILGWVLVVLKCINSWVSFKDALFIFLSSAVLYKVPNATVPARGVNINNMSRSEFILV